MSFTSRQRFASISWLVLLILAGPCVASAAGAALDIGPDSNPELATGYTSKQAAYGRHFMAVTANPRATRVAYDILQAGGSAVDAAIAAQMMLTLTEPQSSGIGGGAFLVHYSAGDGSVKVFDGRETAPAAADAQRFMAGSRPMRFVEAVNSGKSVGVPGVLRALEMAHARYGKLPWAALFEPAIRAAEQGFPISERLAEQIAQSTYLPRLPAARAYFYHADGTPRAEGERLRNPALARTLRTIAQHGADAFYHGDIAADIVHAVDSHPTPGDLTPADLANYAAVERPSLCRPYRIYIICGAPPPSSGGIALLQMLTILARTPLRTLAPNSAAAVHYFAEAGSLAYADRNRYVADPAFIDVPVEPLLDPAYLARRAALIAPDHSMGEAPPGEPEHGALLDHGVDDTHDRASTTHLSIIDRDGNAVSMTSTIEQEFGSKIWVRGFLLNNELTDFSLSPTDAQGRPVANRVQGGKRPRSTMAPTIVLQTQPGAKPRLRLIVGSPGGSAIVNYVAKTAIANLDWGLDIQSAIDLPNRGSRNAGTELERATVLETLAAQLTMMGHQVSLQTFPSGVQAIEVLSNGLLRAGADPHRESSALGK